MGITGNIGSRNREFFRQSIQLKATETSFEECSLGKMPLHKVGDQACLFAYRGEGSGYNKAMIKAKGVTIQPAGLEGTAVLQRSVFQRG